MNTATTTADRHDVHIPADIRAHWAALAAAAPTQAQIDANAALAADLLDTLTTLVADWFGDDVDGLTLTARGNFFGAFQYADTYDYVRTGRVTYVDDDLDTAQARALAMNLGAFIAVAADEHLDRRPCGQVRAHLVPQV